MVKFLFKKRIHALRHFSEIYPEWNFPVHNFPVEEEAEHGRCLYLIFRDPNSDGLPSGGVCHSCLRFRVAVPPGSPEISRLHYEPGTLFLTALAILGVSLRCLSDLEKRLEFMCFLLVLQHRENFEKLHISTHLLLETIVIIGPSICLKLLEVISQFGVHKLSQELNSYLFFPVINFGLRLFLGWTWDMSAAEMLSESGENCRSTISENLALANLATECMPGSWILHSKGWR